MEPAPGPASGAGHGRREAGEQPPGVERLRRGLDDGGREREERRLELGESGLEAEYEPLELASQRQELRRWIQRGRRRGSGEVGRCLTASFVACYLVQE
jgi:hypothetical protein